MISSTARRGLKSTPFGCYIPFPRPPPSQQVGAPKVVDPVVLSPLQNISEPLSRWAASQVLQFLGRYPGVTQHNSRLGSSCPKSSTAHTCSSALVQPVRCSKFWAGVQVLHAVMPGCSWRLRMCSRATTAQLWTSVQVSASQHLSIPASCIYLPLFAGKASLPFLLQTQCLTYV